MTYSFSKRSLSKLQDVHPKMVLLMMEAIKTSPIDFCITCGVRTLETQKQMYKLKRSKCDGIVKKSNHQVKKDGFSYAVDIVSYPVDWSKEKFKILANHIKATAKALNIKIRWGGDFTMVDMPHFELV